MPHCFHCHGYFKHFISSVTWAASSLRAKKLRGPGWLRAPPAEQRHLGLEHRSISPAELLASPRGAGPAITHSTSTGFCAPKHWQSPQLAAARPFLLCRVDRSHR